MIRDCDKGKIDLIVTKSVARFARNTVDSLRYVRKLEIHSVNRLYMFGIFVDYFGLSICAFSIS